MALITLDNGHDHTKPNTFGVRGLLSLNAALDAIEARVAAGEVTAVGVTGKPFILGAGADLDGAASAFGGGRREPGGGARASARDRVARPRGVPAAGGAGRPSFGFINGVALGGGLEVALHCTYRTISSGVAMVALPECFLGLVPGWGGAYLLPRLIGPSAALKVIIESPLAQNKMLRGPEAFGLGIADVMFEPADFPRAVAALGRAVLTGAVSVPARELHPPGSGTPRWPPRASSWTASCTARRPLRTGRSTWWPRRGPRHATRRSRPRTTRWRT